MNKFLSLSNLIVVSAICMSIENLRADWSSSNSRPNSHYHCDNKVNRDSRWSAPKHCNNTENGDQYAKKYTRRRQLPARTYDYDSVY